MPLDIKDRVDSFDVQVFRFHAAWDDEPSIAPHCKSSPGLTTGTVLGALDEGHAIIRQLQEELSAARAEAERWSELLGPADDLIEGLGAMLVEAGHMHLGNITGAAEEGTEKDYRAACSNLLAGVIKAVDESTLLREGQLAPLAVAKRIVADAASEIAAEEWDEEIDDDGDVVPWSQLSVRNRTRMMKNVLGSMFDDMDAIVPSAQSPETAPVQVFSPDDVVKLGKRQMDGKYHPYTCANRGDGKHGSAYGDLGALIPTVNGWICPFCDYKQGWAHEVVKTEAAATQEVVQTVVDNGDGTSDVTLSLPQVASAKPTEPMLHDIEAAAEIVALHNRASTSFLQLRLKCSREYAGKIMEALVERGIVSEPNNVGKRDVLDFSFVYKAKGFPKAISEIETKVVRADRAT